ncbi:hypothetical protein PDIDSM_3226 [Penicillium digitatum]|nr:hypothetical protein PDIDSM_3226 [Penicillium digitatum]
MATQQGPARRNGGPIGPQMVPGPSSTAKPSSSLINQGPPHRITPLVGPDTAHSTPIGARPSQAQREVSALNERLSDAEATIHRQEMELSRARSQASALQSKITSTQRRTTCFVEQRQMEMLCKKSTSNRAREIDAQFQILDHQLDQVSEDLERAEGKKAALQDVRRAIEKDRRDLQDLRQIVAAAGYSLQRQKRLAGAEDRVKGLFKNLEKMLAAAMQGTRGSQVQTRKAPIAESSTHPVGIERRYAVGCQEPGSQAAFDPHPRELGKGKERGPRSLQPEDHEVNAYISIDIGDADCSVRSRSESPSVLSDFMSLDSRKSSRAGSPMNVKTEATEQELAAHMLQADESQVGDQNAAVQEAPATTLTITPQQVENNDMMIIENQLFYSEVAKLNGEATDGYMEWDWEPAQKITFYNKDDLAAPSQASSGQPPLIPAVTANADDVLMVAGQISSAVIPPDSANASFIPISPRLGHTIAEGVMIARETPKLPSDRDRVFKRRDRLTGSRRRYVRRRVIEFVNLPVRKRRAGIVEFSENEGPNCKKRITKEMVEANGSLLLSLSEVYVMNTAPKVPEMSVPAVSQPTLTALEYTESVKTDQAVTSEPAVSQPTSTVLEHTETVSTEQVPSEAAMSAPAVPQPTQAGLESTMPESGVLEYTTPASTVSIPSDEVVGAPAPSEPAPIKSTQTEQSSADEILSVPAVTKPTPNESDLTWQTENEVVVPILRTGTRSHLDVLLAMRAARTQAHPSIMSSPEGLQVTATPRIISTSSLDASPEDASVKNAVATGTDSRAGVSKGTKRVEDAEIQTCSAQQTAGELREEMGGEEATTSGHQMPGAWPSDPPAVTVSDESDMHEISALLRGLWTGTRWLSFGVFLMVMVMLLSFPLWADHLEHLAYALEGPEQFLEELRWEHGYDVPFLERIIYVFLRCFAGDRTLFG